MLQTHMFTVLLWVLLSFCFISRARAYNDSEGAKDDSNFYELYEALDTLVELTPHQTFYELLGVPPDADDSTISRAFRRTSVLFHPDKLKHQGKWDERTERVSKLVQFVGTLMRSERGRKDYDWVLNEAPAWHRQTVYVMRKWMPSSKLSIRQVAVIVMVFSVGMPLLIQWFGYIVAWYMILSSRWEMRGMGEKEVKRMRKRIVGADPAFIAMNYSTYHTIMLADSPSPPFPNPLNLWVFRLPMYIIKSLIPTGDKAKAK